MSRFQIGAVAICVALNAMDGFDILSISFASPGIATEWGIDRASLGIVMSMELIGMAVGSIVLGGLADSFGRRPTIISCLTVMAIGMLLAAQSPDIAGLALCRLVTGLGIGGMLAAVNAMVAEFSNRKRRAFAITIMAAGYPAGAILGGMAASALIAQYDWRAIFLFGGAPTAALIPIVLWRLPESIEFLIHKRPPSALRRVNATLEQMGHQPVAQLPQAGPDQGRKTFADLFGPGHALATTALTATCFLHMMSFYFMLKWIPKIVVDMGFAPATAAGALVWANVGGVTGGLLFGFLTRRFALRSLLIFFLICSGAAVITFGYVPRGLGIISLVVAITGFFTNAVIVGLYALTAQSFPTPLRARGTGLVIGIGRGGAAFGPMAAGFLFSLDYGLPAVAATMAAGSILGAFAIICMRWKTNAVADPGG